MIVTIIMVLVVVMMMIIYDNDVTNNNDVIKSNNSMNDVTAAYVANVATCNFWKEKSREIARRHRFDVTLHSFITRRWPRMTWELCHAHCHVHRLTNQSWSALHQWRHLVADAVRTP